MPNLVGFSPVFNLAVPWLQLNMMCWAMHFGKHLREEDLHYIGRECQIICLATCLMIWLMIQELRAAVIACCDLWILWSNDVYIGLQSSSYEASVTCTFAQEGLPADSESHILAMKMAPTEKSFISPLVLHRNDVVLGAMAVHGKNKRYY